MADDVAVTQRKSSVAVIIQKTYRGYRARRKLADAAIMSKPVGWWNVVDSVLLQEHTILYYAYCKTWKTNDHWKRLRVKASKLGKGLEKDKKACKLALQHWLEAVDARHRYGHNLRPYYLHWLELDTGEPFFYWMDLGDGRQVELQECSRATLQQQQIKYLSPEQRRHYEVAIYNGKLFYKTTGELVHTGSTKNDRWIFVMSPAGRMYIGRKQKGVFQHSSFLAGGATTAAGRLVVEHGVLRLLEAHSGHYRPSPENFETLLRILIASGADLQLAKVQLVSDDLVGKNGKQLAGEVRAGVEHAGAEGHIAVNIVNQDIVTVGSGIEEGLSEHLVTNLTFPKFDHAVAEKRQADQCLAATKEADRARQEQPAGNGPAAPERPCEGHLEPAPAAQEDEPKQPASVENPLNPNLPKIPTVPHLQLSQETQV